MRERLRDIFAAAADKYGWTFKTIKNLTLKQVADVLARQPPGGHDAPAVSGRAITESAGPPSLEKDLCDLETLRAFLGERLAGYEEARAKILQKWGVTTGHD